MTGGCSRRERLQTWKPSGPGSRSSGAYAGDLQLEREKRELQQQQQQKKMELQKDYREQMARLQSDREKRNQEEALAEKRRQQWVREKDEWKRLNESKMAEKLQRRQQKLQVGLEMFAAQERLRKEAEDLMIARASANREVSAKRVRSRRHKNMVTPMDLKDHHESVQRERQLRVEEERKSRKDTLALNNEADAAFREGERVAARDQERSAASHGHRASPADGREGGSRIGSGKIMSWISKSQTRRCWRTRTLSSRRMRKGSSARARNADGTPSPSKRPRARGAEQGLGPIYGGLRATYLASGSEPMPEYVSRTRKDTSQVILQRRQVESGETRLHMEMTTCYGSAANGTH